MVKISSTASVLALGVTAFATTNAHPGEHHNTRSLDEVAQRRLFHANAHRSLAACSNKEASRKLNEDAARRREAKITELRSKRAARRLDATSVAAVSHKSNLTDVTPTDFDLVTLFGSTNKCVLEPIVTEGPYYVSGELIRNDVRESEPGIDLYAELQFIDVNTCEPVPSYFVDFWHSNSSGVYAGVVASGNGNGNDLTNINATHGRGIYPTDDDGVVQFITKFPGHYDGRATHVHVMGHSDGTLLPNNTYSGGNVGSVGQIFFDQDLLVEVNSILPYSEITAEFVLNTADHVFQDATATGFDPILEYVQLGDSIEDGIFGWSSIGVDMTTAAAVTIAATWTVNGGVATGNKFSGDGGSGAPGGSGIGGGSGMGGPPNGSGMGGVPPSGSFAGNTPVGGLTSAPSTSSTGSVGSDTTPAATSSCRS